MDGPAVEQVTAHADLHMVEPALFAAERYNVGQRLGGVQVTAVAAVYQRDLRIERSRHRRALDRVPHGDNVGIAADDRNGVLEALALGYRGVHGIVKADGAAAELEHRGLKGHLRARARLIKERRQNLSVAGVAVVGRTLHDFACLADQLVDLCHTQRFEVDQILV